MIGSVTVSNMTLTKVSKKMAKKKALRKSAPVELVGNDINVDLGDVLSIAVSRAETMMQEKVDEQKAVYEDLSKQVIALTNEIKLDCSKDAEIKFGDAIESAKNGYTTLTEIPVEHSIDIVVSGLNEVSSLKNGHYQATISLQERQNRTDVYGYHNRSFCQTVRTVKIPSDVVAKLTNLHKLEKQAKEAQESAVLWRRKLSNIDKLERTYRGRIAEQKLSQTEEGRSVIQALVGNVQDDILSLPPA